MGRATCTPAIVFAVIARGQMSGTFVVCGSTPCWRKFPYVKHFLFLELARKKLSCEHMTRVKRPVFRGTGMTDGARNSVTALGAPGLVLRMLWVGTGMKLPPRQVP